MFGRRFFGASYWGPRYWGGEGAPAPEGYAGPTSLTAAVIDATLIDPDLTVVTDA